MVYYNENQNQNQNQNQNYGNEAGAREIFDQYDRETVQWNNSNHVQLRRQRRTDAINNTDGYHTGNRVHHLRSIQVATYDIWNQLFGREILNPTLREYVQACLDFNNDENNHLPFAGQMEVSLIMKENYRPGVHVAIFIIYLTPHRQFHDGHIIQMVFGEGSQTHLTVNTLFDPNERAIVSQATEYSILEYAADDDEMLDLLHMCFIDRDFVTMKYSFEEGEHDNEYFYIEDPVGNGNVIHRWHNFGFMEEENVPGIHNNNEYAVAVAPVRIPPPPPVNDFAEIYRYNYNIIQYNNIDDGEDEYQENLPAQG